MLGIVCLRLRSYDIKGCIECNTPGELNKLSNICVSIYLIYGERQKEIEYKINQQINVDVQHIQWYTYKYIMDGYLKKLANNYVYIYIFVCEYTRKLI